MRVVIFVHNLVGGPHLHPDHAVPRRPDPDRTKKDRNRNTGKNLRRLIIFSLRECLTMQADHTYTLIMRLHHNVVKTAVRTISLAYSRITFADIARKLLLDSPEDAEFIVAKVKP
jgi:PCI domain